MIERDREVRIVRSDGAAMRPEADRVAVEEPLEIRIEGKPLGVTMRTPGDDEELAAGLLLAEGVIEAREDIGSIAVCRNPENPDLRNVVDVFLRPGIEPDWERLRRSLLTNSSCGLCGKASIEALATRAERLPDDSWMMKAGTLLAIGDGLRAQQAVFGATGGLHAAALLDREGRTVYLREDIGRHNAVDKVIGAALMQGPFPLSSHLLMVSGRASYEIVQKAIVARIPCAAAVSAASSLAVDLAAEFGLTLVGFLRGSSFNIYAHSHRIVP